MSFRLRWLGTACFEIFLSNQKTIVIDPYVDDSVGAPISSDQFEGCDYMFITHGHYDHVLDVGKLAERFQPKIFCSEITANAMIEHQRLSPNLFHRVTPDVQVQEDDLSVEVVRGLHVDFAKEFKRLTGHDMNGGGDLRPEETNAFISKIFGQVKQPEKLNEWMANYPPGEQLNFIFEPKDGKRIYMAGTYPDPSLIEVAQRANAHITLLQVLSGHMLKGLEEQTANMAIASGCKVVIPQHHDPLFEGGHKTDLSELKRIIREKSDITFMELTPGQWYEFN